jgi:hypothetical protein|tara:strand:- start:16516 stop:16650 length:135 start_codon:yes stop_codon:yes gene_type:complete
MSDDTKRIINIDDVVDDYYNNAPIVDTNEYSEDVLGEEDYDDRA